MASLVLPMVKGKSVKTDWISILKFFPRGGEFCLKEKDNEDDLLIGD